MPGSKKNSSRMKSYLDQQSKLAIHHNLFITLDLAPAGTVLLTQAPLASVPLPSEQLHRCNYCLRKGNLQCCSRCHSAYFCSNDCFLNAWISFHRASCQPSSSSSSSSSNNSLSVENDVHLQLLQRAALTLDSHTTTTTAKKSTPILQQHGVAIHAFNTLELQPTTMTQETRLFLEKSVNITNRSLDELYQLWKRVQISSFPITDPDTHLDTVAMGIYPITSQYVRHSCRPNTGLIYKQGHQLLVALEDIPQGTPITISYVDLMATKKQRQHALAERFGFQFECDCERCQGDFQGLDVLFERGEALNISSEEITETLEEQLKSWSILGMIHEYASKGFDASAMGDEPLDAPHLTHFICRMIVPDVYIPAFTLAKRKLSAALNHVKLPPLRQKRYNRQDDSQRILPAIDALLAHQSHQSPFFTIVGIKAADKLLSRLITQGKWVEASRCAIYMFMVYRMVYPALYPEMAYHTLIMARTSWNSLVQLELAGIGKKLEAVYQNSVQLWISVASDSILKIFGQETFLWREAVEIKWLFERDQKLKLTE
ncbi:uncharacterized protein EV154DRAFT_557017 [Mucor mucedo]|uniref:uncharacterized protein n=1 Tax=Mucor mucedo TaxID=29922 RepID=UPI00221F8160|nr:uncharacterized protein EV154DRAFT_557017 [Mucor mucedo]KAI7867081.1 hypothetical protein EV154DRAFT_557017 [Mucor mucedo]